ncbi:MAG: hypothetical protein AAF530_18685 [Pseudomonadota bacterium]
MTVVDLQDRGKLQQDLARHDLKGLPGRSGDRLKRAAVPLRESSQDYAALVRRHGITSFEFRYQTGHFYALDEKGDEVASGQTIQDLLAAL